MHSPKNSYICNVNRSAYSFYRMQALRIVFLRFY